MVNREDDFPLAESKRAVFDECAPCAVLVEDSQKLRSSLMAAYEYANDRSNEIVTLIEEFEKTLQQLEKAKAIKSEECFTCGFDLRALPVSKYVSKGLIEKINRRINPFSEFRRARSLLLNSRFFDVGYYYSIRPDLAGRSKKFLATHYLLNGARQGESPSEWFDSVKYFAENKTVSASGENPLVDFLKRTS